MNMLMQDIGASDSFTRATTDLLAFIEEGSSELQERHKPSVIEASYPAPQLSSLQRESSGDDAQGEIMEQINAWPAVEDPYLNLLVVDFHTKCGCNIASLHNYIAVLRVLQLHTLLHLDYSVPHNKKERQAVTYLSDVNAINDIVMIMPSLSQLFGKDILANMCLSLPPCLPSVTAKRADPSVTSALNELRSNFLRYCFQRLVLVGGPEDFENQTASVVSWSKDHLPSHATLGSNSFTGSAIAANAAVVCYQLGDLWGLNVQMLRIMHMAVLLDADSGNHALSSTSAETHVWRDFEVENLLPMVI